VLVVGVSALGTLAVGAAQAKSSSSPTCVEQSVPTPVGGQLHVQVGYCP